MIELRIEFESNEIPIYRPIMEDEERIDTPEGIQVQLKEIAEKLGYQYIENSSHRLGKGTISITNDLDIIIKYDKAITSIFVVIGNTLGNSYTPPMYDCTYNSSTIDDVSVALQTASMICAEIRQKLM